MTHGEERQSDEPIVIKKYRNRRLFNTATCKYVTLDDLACMAKAGILFDVHDAPTGEKVTGTILIQIIFEEEAKGQALLSKSFLRQLIPLYGDSLQAFVPSYLDMSMDSFTRNEEGMKGKIKEAIGSSALILENMAEQNRTIFEQTMQMFTLASHKREGEAA